MKKEKTVRTYQRRTKSGKMVTVREHKASYDAAEEARKAAAKKAGAGSELSKKKAAVEENPLGFSADDYKEWYHWDMEDDANNEAALRVEKALIKKMGKKAYNKYLEDMSNSYSARGHKKAHQALLDEYTASQKKQDAESSKAAKDIARSAKEKAAEDKVSKSEFTQPPHSIKYKYKGETYYIKRENVGGLTYKPTDVLNSKGEKLSKDEADAIKEAQQKSAERADKRADRRSNVDKEQMRLHGWADMGESTNKTKPKKKAKDSAKTPSVPENLEKFGGSSLMIGDNAIKAVKQLKEAGLKSFKSGVMTYYVHPDGKSVYAYDTEDGELRRRSTDRREFARHDKTIDKIISSYGTPTTSSSRSMTTDYSRDAKTKTTSTTGAGADWSKATVDKIGREYGGGYTIVGTPNDSLWSSTNFRTKSQALDFIKRKQKESSAKVKESSSSKTKKEEDKSRRSATPETSESYAKLKRFEGSPYRMRISKNGDPMPGEKQKLAKWKAGHRKLKEYLSTPEGAADKKSYVAKQKEKERKAEEKRKRDVAKWREKYTAEKKAKKEKFAAKVSELKGKGFKAKKRVTTKYTSYLKGVNTVLDCFVSPDKKSAYVYRSGEESPTLRKATAKELKIIIGEAKAKKPTKMR